MMFAKLLAHPEVQEVVELRGKFGFMAYHGGGLEHLTDVIAQQAAEQSDSSVLRRASASRTQMARAIARSFAKVF